jgi:hypothetical protein
MVSDSPDAASSPADLLAAGCPGVRSHNAASNPETHRGVLHYVGRRRRATESFVDSYRASGGRVSPEEDDLIVPLVRVKRILEVLRAPTDRHPRWDYQLANLRAYQRIR